MTQKTKTTKYIAKSPRVSPLDKHIGDRVRMARKLSGLTQDQLAGQLSLTFQQVQKYECGANRVSASRLLTIASITGQPLTFFYEDYADPPAIEGAELSKGKKTPVEIPPDARHVRKAADALVRMKPRVRTRIIALINALDTGEAD